MLRECFQHKLVFLVSYWIVLSGVPPSTVLFGCTDQHKVAVYSSWCWYAQPHMHDATRSLASVAIAQPRIAPWHCLQHLQHLQHAIILLPPIRIRNKNETFFETFCFSRPCPDHRQGTQRFEALSLKQYLLPFLFQKMCFCRCRREGHGRGGDSGDDHGLVRVTQHVAGALRMRGDADVGRQATSVRRLPRPPAAHRRTQHPEPGTFRAARHRCVSFRYIDQVARRIALAASDQQIITRRSLCACVCVCVHLSHSSTGTTCSLYGRKLLQWAQDLGIPPPPSHAVVKRERGLKTCLL